MREKREIDFEMLQRLSAAINAMDTSRNSFAVLVGIDQSYLRKCLKGEKPFSRNALDNIEKYSPINMQWLRTGDGRMFSKKIERREDGKPKRAGVPFFNVDFAGGFSEFDDKAIRPTSYINMPGTNGATCWCRVSGDSMSPIIDNGDLICLRLINEWNVYIEYGGIYAIDTVGGVRTVKRIEKGSRPQRLTLIPENKHMKPREIDKLSVRRVFKVIAITKFV